MKVPKKIAERISRTLGQFQRVLADAKKRDVNESDTVTIITDMLADVSDTTSTQTSLASKQYAERTVIWQCGTTTRSSSS